MKLVGLPKREKDERPITDKQINYLLDIVPYLKERDLRKLGIKQASYLIEQALADKEEDEEDDEDEIVERRKLITPFKIKRRSSLSCGLFILIGIVAILVTIILYSLFS